MDAKECGLILGYAFIVVLFFYVIFKIAAPAKKREPFKARKSNDDDDELMPKERLESYQRIASKRSDELNIGKHRATYQDTLAQLEDNVNLAMLQMVHEGGSDIPEDDKMDKIQKMQHFKSTLKGLDDFLDYHKA